MPDLITVATIPEIASAMWRANKYLNLGLEQKDIPLLLAQVAFETGLGKAMHCWNLGNAKSVVGDGRSWTFFRCNEKINGQIVWFDQDHPACRFRAFRGLEEGAIDHLAMLRKNFARAWPALLTGDPVAYCAALKAACYFTADLDVYTAGVSSLYRSFVKKLPADLESIPMPWTAEDEEEVAELCPGNAQRMISIGVCEPPHVNTPMVTTQASDEEALACLDQTKELASNDLSSLTC
jgi:hypothetical protein